MLHLNLLYNRERLNIFFYKSYKIDKIIIRVLLFKKNSSFPKERIKILIEIKLIELAKIR